MQFSYPKGDNSWREKEGEQFANQRDKNSDGVLTKDEISVWLYPPNNDPFVNEAKHLIYHADVNEVRINFVYSISRNNYSQLCTVKCNGYQRSAIIGLGAFTSELFHDGFLASNPQNAWLGTACNYVVG